MIDIPIRSEAPVSRDTIMSINLKRVDGPLDRHNIGRINRVTTGPSPAAPGGGAGPANRAAPPAQAAPAAAPAAQPPMRIPPLRNPVRKGQKTALETGGRLNRIKVCMGWNTVNPACDIDVSAFLLNNGRAIEDSWFVFYGQPESPDRSTVFSEQAQPDRESISVDFGRLNPAVDRIAFVLTIHEALERRLNFSMIKDAYIRILDPASNQELVSYKIDEYYANVTSMTIGELYMHNGAWKFNAVGNGVGKDLAGLCQQYGVQVE